MEWKDLFLRATSALRGAIGEESIGCCVVGSGCCATNVLRTFRAERTFRPRVRLETCAERCRLLVVAGRISLKAAPEILEAYREIEEPRCVVAIGSCASSGGLFDTYGVLAGAGRLFPVDLFVPGCPPDPEAIRKALQEVAEQVRLLRSSSRASGVGGKVGRKPH